MVEERDARFGRGPALAVNFQFDGNPGLLRVAFNDRAPDLHAAYYRATAAGKKAELWPASLVQTVVNSRPSLRADRGWRTLFSLPVQRVARFEASAFALKSELVYSLDMSSVNEIETAVSKLSRTELLAFRDWFSKFDAAAWGKQFEADVPRDIWTRLPTRPFVICARGAAGTCEASRKPEVLAVLFTTSRGRFRSVLMRNSTCSRPTPDIHLSTSRRLAECGRCVSASIIVRLRSRMARTSFGFGLVTTASMTEFYLKPWNRGISKEEHLAAPCLRCRTDPDGMGS